MPKSFHKVAELVLAIRFIPTVKHLLDTRHYIIQDMCQLLQSFHMKFHIVPIPAPQKLKFRIDFFITFIALQLEPFFNSIVRNHYGIKFVGLCPSDAVVLRIFLHCKRINNRHEVSFVMKECQYRQMINASSLHHNSYLSLQFFQQFMKVFQILLHMLHFKRSAHDLSVWLKHTDRTFPF